MLTLRVPPELNRRIDREARRQRRPKSAVLREAPSIEAEAKHIPASVQSWVGRPGVR